MTQPPDPHSSPYQPVNYPAAGQQPSMNFPTPQQPYQGGMRGIDQNTTVNTYARPTVVVIGFALWLLVALSWPLGTLLRQLAEGNAISGFGIVMALFLQICLFVGGVVGAAMFLRGSYQARLALCGTALILEVFGVVSAVAVGDADLDGAALVIGWLVAIARLVLPPLAVLASLAPGTRQYFAANLG
ncbi:MAG: hypothetical protein ABIQ18_45430 [Umezawaea sp.]